MTIKSILVFVPGFGLPHWNEKIGYLRNNHQAIIGRLPENINLKYLIIQYTDLEEYNIPIDIFTSVSSNDIHIIKKKGLLGENMYYNASPQYLSQFGCDYIFMMLDDIEFHANVPWDDIFITLNNQLLSTPKIVSPCLGDSNSSSWEYMMHIDKYREPTIILRNRCEFFVYFMDFQSYANYYTFIHPGNPFLWGMDFILAMVMKLPPAILNHWIIKHHYRGTTIESRKAESQAHEYIKNLGLNYPHIHALPPGESIIPLSIVKQKMNITI